MALLFKYLLKITCCYLDDDIKIVKNGKFLMEKIKELLPDNEEIKQCIVDVWNKRICF